MFKNFIRILSLLLIISMLWNMLPVSVLGADLREALNADDDAVLIEPEFTLESQEPEEITILGEITERRTENIKEYLLSNGNTLAAVYGDSVHYQDSGEWKDIDNTLIAKNGTYVNTAGIWDVSFPQTLNSNNRISITKDGYTLSFGMAGKLTLGSSTVVTKPGENVLYATEMGTVPTITISTANASLAQIQQLDFVQAKTKAQHPELVRDKLTSRLSYSQVYADTDVVYDLDSNRVKESVILSRYDATLRGYRYTLQTGSMIPVLSDDGHIDFYDAQSEEIVMTMPAPFLVDANFECSWDVEVTLTGSGNTYTLTYTLPQQWLAAEDRAWPVVLDPVVTVDDLPQNIVDQTVFSQTTKADTWAFLQCGFSTDEGVSRFLLKFEELPELTSSDIVVDASVTLSKVANSAVPFYVGVHGVTEDWMSNTITWSEADQKFNGNVADFVMLKNAGEYSWDVTEIARDWYQNNTNYGMMFKASEAIEGQTVANDLVQFCSSDYGSCEPSLLIEYRNASGLENYWDYVTASAGSAGTAYVNAYSGNLVFVRHLMGFSGNRMPVSIDLVHNSGDRYSNGFGIGYGWRTNYHQRIYAFGSDHYVWEDADGTRHYFRYNATDGVYYDEDNLNLTIIENYDEDNIFITDLVGNTSTFDVKGRLIKLQNNQETPSSIDITYVGDTNLISQITDGVGRVYTFSYSSNQLTRISYMATAQTEQHYVSFNTSNGTIINIAEKDGGTCFYAYTDNLLTKARDAHGVSIDFSYYTEDEGYPNRVKQISENDGTATGNYINFEYGNKWTKLTDKQENVRYMLFNAHGNTVSVQNDKGAAVFAEYATDQNAEEEAHKLILASDLQSTTINLLGDGNFEDATSWYGVTNGTATLLANGAYIGANALNVAASSTADATVNFGSFTADAGASYTLSAYLKAGTGKTHLRFTNGNTVCAESLDSTDADCGQWKRFEVTYTNTSSDAQTIYAEAFIEQCGTVAFDCVQLEKAVSSGRYNLVENSDFTTAKTSYNYKWSESNLTLDDGREITTSPATVMDGNTMKISGAPTTQKRVSQRINISGSNDDVFVFAGWGKGYVPNETETYYGQRRFGLELTFYASDDIIVSTNSLSFSPHLSNWQYAAKQVKPDCDYAYIVIALVCDYNIGDVFFDGIQLYKEGFGDTYTYNANGDVEAVTNSRGQQASFHYTGRDLTSVFNFDESITSYEYDDYKNVKKETTTYLSDSVDGNPTEFTTEYTYDTYGNTTSVTSTGAGTTSATYTENGNYLSTVTDEQNRTTAYNYNHYTGTLVNTTDPLGNVVAYGYDGLLRQTNAHQMVGSHLMAVAYGYSGDRLTSVTTPSTAYTISYGTFGAVQSITAGDYTLATYEYDANQNLSNLIYGNGDEIEYTYDSKGRVVEERYINGTDTNTVTYTYDEKGTLVSVNDGLANRVTFYRYDAQNRVASAEIYENGIFLQSIRYNYNEYDQVTGKTDVIGTQTPVHTSYSYNSLHLLSEINKDNICLQATYNELGLLQTLTTAYTTTDASNHTAKQEAFTYGDSQDGYSDTQLYQHAVTYGSKTNSDTYTYDALGNITQIVHKIGISEYVTNYTYDEAGQLIREDNQRAGSTWIMTYDDAGNLIRKKEYPYNTVASSSMTSMKMFGYTDTTWGDRITAIGFPLVESDEIGNILSDGTWEYAWKNGRQLAAMTQDDTTWTFTYDAGGMRTKRTSGNKTYTYTYEGNQLIHMTVGSSTMSFLYGANGLPTAVKDNGTYYYYVTNALGDVVAIINSSGTEVVKYVYDAWGNIISTTGTMANSLGVRNPFRYRSYIYDYETGLYYLQSRYYNPTICRFINADSFVSTGQGILGHNMFAYCKNNPVLYSDSTGNRAQIWPVLFRDHRPGYIHAAVQAHILINTALQNELHLPGVGRADIYNPETHEIWEIKHAASIPSERIASATTQIDRYIDGYEISEIICTRGHVGAFTGSFHITCENISYLISYDTPAEGVILYYVTQLRDEVREPEYSYAPIALKQTQNVTSIAVGAGIAASLLRGGGGGILGDPLCYRD